MRICLLRPPTFIDESTYPYNLECISTALKAAGHEVSWVDGGLVAEAEASRRYRGGRLDRFLNRLFLERKINKLDSIVESFFTGGDDALWDDIAARVVSAEPDVVGVSCYSASMSSTCRILASLRGKHGFTGKVVLGGIHPSSCPEEVLARVPESDVVVVGEGEETVVELMEAFSGGDPGGVGGIAYRDGGRIVRTGPRSMIPDLGVLADNRFDNVADGNYMNFVVLTSRGCPYNCKFCASNVVFSRRVRYRPPAAVAEEVRKLVDKTGTRFVRFGDDTFTVSIKHMKAVRDELKKQGVTNVAFSVGSRIDTMNADKLQVLREMGVVTISFGVETGSRRMIEEIDKNIKLEDVVPTIKMVNDAGISTTTFFIINHPGETEADMEGTLRLIRDLNADCSNNQCAINTGFPYPATYWWTYAESKGLVSDIDFYRYSHKYNHQQTPAVNMTAVSEAVLLSYRKKIDSAVRMHNIRVRARKMFRLAVSDPGKLVRKLTS